MCMVSQATAGREVAAGEVTVSACGAGDDPHRGHRRSQAKDVIRIGRHDYRAAMHGRHSDRMGINDVLRICGEGLFRQR